jgi:neutral ceramidase
MSRWKKIVLGIVVVLLVLTGSFVLFIGPWPVYRDSKFETSKYYQSAIEAIVQNAAETTVTDSPDALKAAWAKRSIVPKIGTPLAGYGDRRGAPSTGVRDELYVKALALSDGEDTAVILGADILIIPPNIAELVREQVAAQTPLSANDIYFTASHTHCGPGAFGPGLASKISAGTYDPEVPPFIANAFAEAIIEAYKGLKPAKMASGYVDAPEYIRNRARQGPVDSILDYAIFEQEDGNKCFLVRFSAHPTIFGGRMREFTAEFPGELQRHIAKSAGAEAIYLGGALGSMSPRAEGATPEERIVNMGRGLAQLVIDNAQDLEYITHADVASVGVPLGMPSLQMRPVSANWRLSPLIAPLFGVPPEGWVHGVRVGDLLFIGTPFDFSGETSLKWKEWGARQGRHVWPTGFSSAYLGYLSPDEYYWVEPLGYETGLMSWFGPNAEAYFTRLYEKIFSVLTPSVAQVALAP